MMNNIKKNTGSTHALMMGLAGAFALSTQAFAFNPGNAPDEPDVPDVPDIPVTFEVTKEVVAADPWFTVYRPANLDEAVKAKGELPVIAWANGGCFRSEFTWEPLFNRWAEEGYVVLALSAAPNANGNTGFFGQLKTTNAEHQGALIDWATEQSEFADKLDNDKIIAAGNSCGGVTSLELTSQDSRIDGVFVLSGSSALANTNEAVMGNINVPVGYVIGGPEDIAGENAANDYEALPAGVPSMIVSRSSGTHRDVSTTPETLEEIADISFHWMDLMLNGKKASYDELKSKDVCSDCTPGDWSMMSKNLESLIK